jgi:hypothetical protein
MYRLVPPQDPSGETTPLGVDPAEEAVEDGRMLDPELAALLEEGAAAEDDDTPPPPPPFRVVRYQLEAGSPKHSPTGTADTNVICGFMPELGCTTYISNPDSLTLGESQAQEYWQC